MISLCHDKEIYTTGSTGSIFVESTYELVFTMSTLLATIFKKDGTFF